VFKNLAWKEKREGRPERIRGGMGGGNCVGSYFAKIRGWAQVTSHRNARRVDSWGRRRKGGGMREKKDPSPQGHVGREKVLCSRLREKEEHDTFAVVGTEN